RTTARTATSRRSGSPRAACCRWRDRSWMASGSSIWCCVASTANGGSSASPPPSRPGGKRVSSADLALVGSVAKLLNEGLGAKVGDGAAEHEVLAIVADFLAPYLAAAELSADLAGEVAAQSREIEEHRRFTSLIVDSLPLGLYVVDRDYRIQSWNRKRETGTQGLRREVVVGRRIFDVLTRQDPERLRTELDRVFQT